MKPIEFYRNELAVLHKELGLANRARLNLKNRIQETVAKIQAIDDLVSDKPRVPVFNYTRRDTDLCYEFIKNNPGCSSKEIVNHVNRELADQTTRWRVLDSNTFMTALGSDLKRSKLFDFEKIVTGNPARRVTVWKIK